MQRQYSVPDFYPFRYHRFVNVLLTRHASACDSCEATLQLSYPGVNFESMPMGIYCRCPFLSRLTKFIFLLECVVKVMKLAIGFLKKKA